MAIFQLLLLCAVGATAFVVRLAQHRRFYRDLPKPPHSLIWGHLKIFRDVMKQFPANTAISVYYTAMAHKYELNGIFYLDLWPFGPSQMVLLTPEAAELVTTTRNYPMHQEVSRYLTPLLGEDAIGASDGDKWKMMHGILAPAFRTSNIKPMASVIADQVLGLFQPALAKYAQSGEIFSMAEVAAEVVFSISSRVVLGTLSEKANAQLLLGINDIVDYAGTLTLTTANNPVDRAVKWWKKGAAVRRIDSFLELLIEERYARIKHTFGNRNPKDNLTILDHIMANGQGPHCNHIDPERLKPAFLRIVIDNLKGLLLGGYGTTADTLCYIFILLSIHPAVAQNLRMEHDEIFGGDLATTRQMLQADPHKVNELHYTTAVIKETLRLVPVGFGARQAKPGSSTITYNGRTYPTSGQMIIPCTHAIHYDPEVFPLPAKFDPTRFLYQNRVPRQAWRPFERGPRACIGQHLAMDELRIILLLTVRQFDFQCAAIEPRTTPRALYTDMDLQLGDLAFQEMAFSARPRGGAMMKVVSLVKKPEVAV